MTELADRSDVIVEPGAARVGDFASIQLLRSSNPLIDGVVVDLRSPEPIVLPNQRRPWQLKCKRIIDIAGALIALMLFSPILIVTGLAIAVTSPGGVLHRQTRIGYLGQEFQFLKFRSMYIDAEERRAELENLNHHNSGPIFKIRHDPRITPVGRIIRKLSIDELPQLFHVVTGKMSLVGPRPPLPSEVTTYQPSQLRRLLVKPGLTCIWQVSGRSDLDFDTWVKMDVSYIENWSLWLDLKLLAKTIPAVLTGRGAY